MTEYPETGYFKGSIFVTAHAKEFLEGAALM
jgi:hypothetical protein